MAANSEVAAVHSYGMQHMYGAALQHILQALCAPARGCAQTSTKSALHVPDSSQMQKCCAARSMHVANEPAGSVHIKPQAVRMQTAYEKCVYHAHRVQCEAPLLTLGPHDGLTPRERALPVGRAPGVARHGLWNWIGMMSAAPQAAQALCTYPLSTQGGALKVLKPRGPGRSPPLDGSHSTM